MRVAVGTKNGAKLSACETVFSEAFPHKKLELLPFEVESGVSAMPMTNEETCQGAINRAVGLFDKTYADFFVGLEGGTYEGPLKSLYLLGWVAIFNSKDNEPSVGHSAAIQLPNDIANELKNGIELGPLMQAKTGDVDDKIRHSLGTNGLLTKGLYPRNKEFEDAIRCALGPLLDNPNF